VIAKPPSRRRNLRNTYYSETLRFKHEPCSLCQFCVNQVSRSALTLTHLPRVSNWDRHWTGVHPS